MEILDLYDDDGIKLDETIERGKKPDNGKNIMLSVVFIKNCDGKYLIQKTSEAKGSEYTSTGGHVTHNEDGLTTIIREIEEEIGLSNINQDEIKYIKTFKYPGRFCLFNVYLYEVIDIEIQNLKLQTSEVSEALWLTKEEIYDLIKKGLFLESHAYIFKNYIDNKR